MFYMKKTCLVTGGLGYIGSHICIELLDAGYDLVIIDNLSNSKIEKLEYINQSNKSNNHIFFYQIDLLILDDLITSYRDFINRIDSSKHIDIIIHLAGLKSVGESINNPIKYYDTNLITTLNLIKFMELFEIKNFIFSSSATVYGSILTPPYCENDLTGLGIPNPYGRSKFIQEEMLKDIQTSKKDWNIILLRYFNPIGHINNYFKEEPTGIPNNLFPYLVRVYNKQLDNLTIFGSDYGTRDGTCSRDFIHVIDLANAHKTCCESIISNKICGFKIYNVGTGTDTTVLELIKTFELVNNCKLNYEFGKKREGDVESSYSRVDLIKKELGWQAKYTIMDCVKI
jgi:UDP-glucose 4-epimerase